MTDYNPLDDIGCLNHVGDPSENCVSCYTILRDAAHELESELIRVREDKRQTIRKAFRAGAAWQVGDHRDFNQVNPDLAEYLKRELGDG